jgi:hypothetical protein
MSKILDLQNRIDDYEEAIATFARLHEELTYLRQSTSVPEAAARLDSMLRLNAETLEAIKTSLTLSLNRMKRRKTPELAPTFSY